MELQEFIKETLVQITNGVSTAQAELKDTGCLINPEGFMMNNKIEQGHKNQYRSVQQLRMNVVLSVSEQKGKKVEIGVAKVVKAGFDTNKSNTNQATTSIEFDIPMALPVMEANNA